MADTENQRVLIVDDERLNRRILLDLLSDNRDIILAKNGSQALEKAEEHLPDLILLDLVMPEMNGYEVLHRLKKNDKTKDIAVIIVSALDSPGDETQGLVSGALDYITKPFNPTVVKARVRNALSLVQQRKMLEKLADLDGLTQLNNRRRFDREFKEAWKHCEMEGKAISLALMDIDYFKQFNDNYGHALGDEALSRVAQVIKSSLEGSQACCARYGGEEFIILLVADCSEIYNLSEKVRLNVEQQAIPHSYSRVADTVTISVGCACCHAGETLSSHDLLELADKMLYRAKKQGRNRVAHENLAISIATSQA